MFQSRFSFRYSPLINLLPPTLKQGLLILGCLYGTQEFIQLGDLVEKVMCAQLKAFLPIAFFRVVGENDDTASEALGLYRFQHLQATHSGHLNVQDEDIWGEPANALHRLQTVLSLPDNV